MIKALEQNPSSEYFLEGCFKNKDAIAGKIKVIKSNSKGYSFGSKLDKSIGGFEVNIESSNCHVVHFTHPQITKHST